LLDLSDIEHGAIVLLRTPSDLSEIVGAAAERWRPRLLEKRLAFDVAPATGDVRAVVDAERIGHVLDALLRNALKCTEAGGAVRVAVRGALRFVEIAVDDTGIGIPAAVRRAVFRKFRQADPALTRRHGGLGLGLTVSREIVRSHRGTIRIEANGGG